MKGRGYTPDPEGHLRTAFSHHPASLAGSTPESAGPFYFAPPVKDQGGTSSCCGHGTSTGISTTLRAAGKPLPWEPSEAELYRNGRAIDRVASADGSFPELTDDGAMPNQIMRAMHEFGIRASRAPTSDGRNSDCEKGSVNDEATLLDLETEALFVPVGEYAIKARGARRVLEVRKALAANLAVCFGTFVDTGVMEWNPKSGPLGAPNYLDPDGGGHWMVALSYRTLLDGKTVVRFRNSWGADWGLDGDGEGNEDFIDAWQDIYVMAVEKRAL